MLHGMLSTAAPPVACNAHVAIPIVAPYTRCGVLILDVVVVPSVRTLTDIFMDAVKAGASILTRSTRAVVKIDVANLLQAFWDVSGHAVAVKGVNWDGQGIGLQASL